jgi:uncharacterized membrane protein YfcA
MAKLLKISLLPFNTLTILTFIAILMPAITRHAQDCEFDIDCQIKFNSFYECNKGDCDRKKIGFSKPEIAGGILIFFISSLANAGGVGGGPMIVTVLVTLFKFAPNHAIPASKVTILAGAVMSAVGLVFQRHHIDKGTLMVNYPLGSLMIPAVLGGTQIGVMLSQLLPSPVTGLLLMTFVAYTLLKLKDKLVKEMAREKASSEEARIQAAPLLEGSKNYIQQTNSYQSIRIPNSKDARLTVISQKMETVAEQEEDVSISELFCKQVPNILILFLAFTVVAICAIIRGGHNNSSIFNIPFCSKLSWTVLLFSQASMVFITLRASKMNPDVFTYHPSLEDGIKQNLQESQSRLPVNVKIVLVSYVSGILSGTLGIGGASLLNALLMSIGFDPQTSSALSNKLQLFSAASSTVQFIAAGAIHAKHAWYLMALSFMGSMVGNYIILLLITMYKKPSIIIWAIMFVLVVSMIVFPIDQYYSTDFTSWQTIFKWGNIC